MIGRLLARRADKKLGIELQDNLVHLFTERCARIVQNDDCEYQGPRSFDFAVATVATPELCLRFVRVRGELSIDIALPLERRWQPIDSALLWLDMQEQKKTDRPFPNWNGASDWDSVDHFLADHWTRLAAAAASPGTLKQAGR